MTLRDYTANVISASKVVPDGNFKDSKASGVWDINEALDLIKGGNWPNAANINPSAFVDGLFSVDLYTGTASAQTITNNIDLTKGGLVWMKSRTGTDENTLMDTEIGTGSYLRSDSANQASSTSSAYITSYNSNGFSVGIANQINRSSSDFVSWTWRKQPKFFDVVTYTGNFTAGKTVSHNLGSVPGMILIKDTSNTRNWIVYHRSIGEGKFLKLNETDAEAANTYNFNNTAPTSTQFTLGESSNTNTNGATYVAYLFAHNNNDGGFGEPGDQDIIKCDKYTGNGNATGPEITLGFEPQFLMIKAASSDPSGNGDWLVADSMRGLNVTDTTKISYWNRTNAEQNASGQFEPTSTGFKITATHTSVNDNNTDYIYMAIRRGGMQTPTTPSDVFAIDTSTSDSSGDVLASTFPVDMYLYGRRDGGSHGIMARLTETRLFTDSTSAEGSLGSYVDFDRQTGIKRNALLGNASTVDYMWKRARGYFDVVTTKSTNGNVNHNLGVVPEMVWYKRRGGTDDWFVCTATDGYLFLNQNARNQGYGNGSYLTNAYGAQATATTVNTGYNFTGVTTADMIIYLFATVAGVSKVGSFTMVNSNGALNVDCGFTNGSKFIIFKRIDSTGNWYVVDTTRGITSGNDPYIRLDVTNAEATSTELVNALSSGFTVQHNQGVVDGDYIFYAIATDPS